MAYHPAFAAGKVAVITGAASGIGLAAARRYAGMGMHVLMADIDGAVLESAAAEVRNLGFPFGARVETQIVDVAQFDEVSGLKARAFAEFGAVHVLMNNAGLGGKSGAWSAPEQWRRIIDVNLFGVVNGTQAFTAAMLAQDVPALIINTGSKQGITNPPGNPAYNVSKAGVKAATESLQHELRNIPGCQVSAHLLVPGYTFTGLTRRRLETKPDGAWFPEEVVDYMVEAITRGSFYIICPDNEVSAAQDRKRIAWAAGDLIEDRPALSRWHPDYAEAFKDRGG